MTIPSFQLDPKTDNINVTDSSPTISVLWDRAIRSAVVNTKPGPTVASRAYSMMHTAMFDAWAAYDPDAISTLKGDRLQRPKSENTIANKTEAMSFAAYRVVSELFPEQTDAFNKLMQQLGFDPNNSYSDTKTAAGIGNKSAEVLLAHHLGDGSNSTGKDANGTPNTPYSDTSGYQPVNQPDMIVDIEHWTPEHVPIDDPKGTVQKFLTPQWGDLVPFALESADVFRPDAPELFLLVDAQVDLDKKTITTPDGKVVKIDRTQIGKTINPDFITQAEQIVELSAHLTDKQKISTEFWENGGGTSYPPGTWMAIGEFVSARDNHSLDDDAKMFFALSNAVCDACIATWDAKRAYDYTRPVRAIRELGFLGLIGEYDSQLGGYAIDAWGGPGLGTQKLLATDFITYQNPSGNPSPPFPEYTSGHSAFSAASAEILKLFTGNDLFGANVQVEPRQSRFEPGVTPNKKITLEWDTFSEAAQEAGMSRLYGGIHFAEGNINGQILGKEVADAVWDKAQFFIQGGDS
jgi:hypothetical protein